MLIFNYFIYSCSFFTPTFRFRKVLEIAALGDRNASQFSATSDSFKLTPHKDRTKSVRRCNQGISSFVDF